MISWLASLVILLVALHHMEVLKPTATGLSWRERVSEFWRASAWVMLGGATFANLIQPFVGPVIPSAVHHALGMLGMAMLLVYYEIRHAWVS
jgi:hypothetical protein